MRYKAGDKVKIKTWEEMKEEVGFNKYGDINYNYSFTQGMEEELNEKFPDRVITVEKVTRSYYHIKDMRYYYTDYEIECRITPIYSRWELLDL